MGVVRGHGDGGGGDERSTLNAIVSIKVIGKQRQVGTIE